MSKKYRLKQDILWYKKGEDFWFDEKGWLWHDDHINEPVRTLDKLQNAIASHFEDEGSEEYFEVLV